MEYYRYLFALTPKNKTRVIWIKAIIPVLLAFTVYYFNLYSVIWVDCTAVAAGLAWMFFLSNKLWDHFIAGQVKNWFKKNVRSTQYSVVHVCFDKEIDIDGKKLSYAQLGRILPLKHVLLFFHGQNEIFLIPNRVIEEKPGMKKFSEFLAEKMRNKN